MTAAEKILDAVEWGSLFEPPIDHSSIARQVRILLTLDHRFIRTATGWRKLTHRQHIDRQLSRYRAKFHILMTNPHALDY